VSSYLNMLPDAFSAKITHTNYYLYDTENCNSGGSDPCISVSAPGYLSFVCFHVSHAKRRKNDIRTRENWQNGRQRNFIRSRSYANLDRRFSQVRPPFLVNI